MREIKIKSAIKDIKALDKTVDLSRRMKNTYIHTKDQAEQLGHEDNCNYVDDAGNSIQEGAKIVVRKAGQIAGSYGKKAVEIIKNRRAPDADAPYYHNSNVENVQQIPSSEVKKTAHKDVTLTKTKSATEQSTISVKVKEAVNQNVSQTRTKQIAKHISIQSRMKGTIKRKFALSQTSGLAKHRFVQNRAKQRFSQTTEIQTANQNIDQIQTQQISVRISAQCPLFQPTRKPAVQTLNTLGKTGPTIKWSTNASAKTVKEAAKGTIKVTQSSVKTAERTAKAAVKTSQAAAKNAAKTAQVSRMAAQAARTAARAAVVSTKTAVKAMLATIKAIIAAAKSLITLIAAGGWIAVAIILVICLAWLLLGSAYGVLFSNENSGENTPVMTEVVSLLNEEFAEEIERIQDENPHDTLDMPDNSSIITNWRDILSVYAVKVAADPKNGMEVATLNDTKVGILRDIFWDMNIIHYWIEIIVHEGTVTTTEIILHINVPTKSYSNMITEYGFNSEQVKILNELMRDEYQQLFMRLTGN